MVDQLRAEPSLLELNSSSFALHGSGDDPFLSGDELTSPVARTTSLATVAANVMTPGTSSPQGAASKLRSVVSSVKRKVGNFKEFSDFEEGRRSKIIEIWHFSLMQTAFKFYVTDLFPQFGRDTARLKRLVMLEHLAIETKLFLFTEAPLVASHFVELVGYDERYRRAAILEEETQEWAKVTAAMPDVVRRHVVTATWLDDVITTAADTCFTGALRGVPARSLRSPVKAAQGKPDGTARGPLTMQSSIEDLLVEAAASCRAVKGSDAESGLTSEQYFESPTAAVAAALARAMANAAHMAHPPPAAVPVENTAALTTSGAAGGAAVANLKQEETYATLLVLMALASRQKEVMFNEAAVDMKAYTARLMKEARQRLQEERHAMDDVAAKSIAAKRRLALQLEMELALLHVSVTIQVQEKVMRHLLMSECDAALDIPAVPTTDHQVRVRGEILFSDRCHWAIELYAEHERWWQDTAPIAEPRLRLAATEDRARMALQALEATLRREMVTRSLTALEEAFYRGEAVSRLDVEVSRMRGVSSMLKQAIQEEVRLLREQQAAADLIAARKAAQDHEERLHMTLDDGENLVGHHEDRHRAEIEHTERREYGRLLVTANKERRVIDKVMLERRKG